MEKERTDEGRASLESKEKEKREMECRARSMPPFDP